jgi:hypothetical protein
MTTTTTTSNDFPLDQLAPLVIVLVVPLLVLYGRNYLSEFAFHMITVASSALPWNWSSIYEHGSIIAKPKKKPAVRTRAEQLAARTDGRPGASPVKHCYCFAETDSETIISEVKNDASEGEKGLFYPGLVNISGTYCFMNSTMQVRPALHPVLFVPVDTKPCHPACIIGTRLSIIPTTAHRRHSRQSRGSRYTHASRRRSARPPSRCDMPSPLLPFLATLPTRMTPSPIRLEHPFLILSLHPPRRNDSGALASRARQTQPALLVT